LIYDFKNEKDYQINMNHSNCNHRFDNKYGIQESILKIKKTSMSQREYIEICFNIRCLEREGLELEKRINKIPLPDS